MSVEGRWFLSPNGSPVAYGLTIAPAGLVLWDANEWHPHWEVAAGHLILRGRDQNGDRMVFPLADSEVLAGHIETFARDEFDDDERHAAWLLRDPGDLLLWDG